MDRPRTDYPDLSDILARKLSGRQLSAALGFSRKLDILDAMRARVEPLVRARKSRTARRMNSQLGENKSPFS
jgi:hypothetical protein